MHPGAAPAGLSGAAVEIAGARLELLPTGALWWPAEGLLAVGDLHLGRSERTARTGSGLIPPYETRDTLNRLEAEVAAREPATVVCLGDSFDDTGAARALAPVLVGRVGALAEGRDWIWVAGNHDPGPPGLPGRPVGELARGPLALRHAAGAERPTGGEISAHYHPKARLSHRGRRICRPCFLWDARRLILPAFGTYTGGLDAGSAAFDALLGREARAGLLGRALTVLPRAALA